jgi:hypothetical protein
VPTRISQVVGNLIQNSERFTDAGGGVTATVDREGDRAAIRVRDTGIGIATDMVARLFERFTQDESLHRAAVSVSGSRSSAASSRYTADRSRLAARASGPHISSISCNGRSRRELLLENIALRQQVVTMVQKNRPGSGSPLSRAKCAISSAGWPPRTSGVRRGFTVSLLRLGFSISERAMLRYLRGLAVTSA